MHICKQNLQRNTIPTITAQARVSEPGQSKLLFSGIRCHSLKIFGFQQMRMLMLNSEGKYSKFAGSRLDSSVMSA